MKSMMKKSMDALFFLVFLPTILLSFPVRAQNTTNVKIGVAVDYNGPVGRVGLNCIGMVVSEFYETRSQYNTRIELIPRDSKSDAYGAASAALDLIKNKQVQAIIGPVMSTQANFVVDIGDKANVPIVSFSAVNPSLSLRSSFFFRATHNEAYQADAIASIVKKFAWKQVVPIYSDDAYGEGLIPYLSDSLLDANNARVPYHWAVNTSSTDELLRQELHKLSLNYTRVFVVHTHASLGVKIFAIAKELGMMSEGYVWIVTNGMTSLLRTLAENKDVLTTLNGVLGLKTYVPETNEVKGFRERYRRRQFSDEMNVFGLWAYDAATALALAVEEVSKSDSGAKLGLFTEDENGVSDLDTFGVSQSGLKLRDALSNVKFKGLSGDIRFVNRELETPTYEIINVVDNNVNKVVGFWRPKDGLVIDLSSSVKSSSRGNIGKITWPGNDQNVPKGWEIPLRGTKLKVGVPVRGGFKEFINVEYNSDHTHNVTGYCIDIFEEVIKKLPYKIEYELMPFVNSSNLSAGTYDDLVQQVYLGVYDAAVGDITIRANRSLYVDFTLPYTESGVSMIVPIKDNSYKNAWVFMKPLKWDLWVTSGCFFVFIGFVVWVLEHRINDEFRGPVSHQIGTSFWFSFSTMVFAHREKIMSNLARFVIIIWVFVVLILTQSYTASLTSLLTAEQRNPTVANVSQLIIGQDNVGFLEASFVHGLLIGLGFNDSQIKVYKSIDELEQAFLNYTGKHGGIAAAFDEKPYMNLFLRKFCSKYTMIDPTFKTDGFGFAFPRGSPLVSDVSRAILQVTEKGTLKDLEKKWFGEKKTCPDPNTPASSGSLGLESFWGLFLIAGLSSLLALAIHAFKFVRQNRLTIDSSVPVEASLGDRIGMVLRVFDQRDLSSHTFRKRGPSPMEDAQGVSRVFPVDEANACAMQTSPSSRHSNDSVFHSVCSSPELGTPVIVLSQLSDLRHEEDVQINTRARQI